jgi:hypothetical protein
VGGVSCLWTNSVPLPDNGGKVNDHLGVVRVMHWLGEDLILNILTPGDWFLLGKKLDFYVER